MFYQLPFAHRPIANVGGLFEENYQSLRQPFQNQTNKPRDKSGLAQLSFFKRTRRLLGE